MRQQLCLAGAALVAVTACARSGLAPSVQAATDSIHSCTPIQTAHGNSEDIVVDGEVAFISADPRREGGKRPGAIFAYDLRTGALETAVTDPGFPFHPHGMGLFVGPDGTRLLFVLNHRTKRLDVVEIFRVQGMRLVRVDSVAGPELVRGNDLVPVGPRSFYVSNTLASTSGLGQAWERLRGSRRSSVLFHDSAGFREVAGGLRFANGVNLSRDGRRLYVATYAGQDLRVFRREPGGALTPESRTVLGTGLDNIDVDSAGGVWIAAHRSTMAMLLYMKRIRGGSPSDVLYLPGSAGGPGAPRTVALDGTEPPALSVAVRHGSRVLLGSVGARASICKLSGR